MTGQALGILFVAMTIGIVAYGCWWSEKQKDLTIAERKALKARLAASHARLRELQAKRMDPHTNRS